MLNAVTPAILAKLSAQMPGLLRDAEPRDLEDPRGRWTGQGRAVACPRTTGQVAEVVRFCNAERVGIVPLGGATGLVGGHIQPEGAEPLILSLERMVALRGAYPEENVLVVEAGMILQQVQDEAEKLNRLFPLSLASEGSARIGGNLGTNAGGVNVLRYGNSRDLVLGIEAVLPDGSIFNGLKRLRKDNTGYDLRHLLIGAEGTLGIITAASLRLFPRPAARVSGLLVVPSPKAALDLLALAEGRLSGMVSAFELIHRTGYDFLAEAMPQVAVPLQPLPEWSVLLDLGLPREIDAEEALAMLYAEADEAGLVSDGVIATNEAQRANLWRIRESIPQANRKIGAVSSHDISLPLSEIAAFIPRATAELAKIDAFRINCFGHLGDGNLHFNVFPMPGKTKKDHEHQREAVKTCVHDIVHDMGGSVSAEHGIGRLKVSDLEKYGDPAKLMAMRAIKAALDPNGIMNPGAVLRDQG